MSGHADLGLICVGDPGAPGFQHAAGDADAGCHHEPFPIDGTVVPGRGHAIPGAVGEVDAGHRPANGEVGLAGQGFEHLLELERGVERARRPRQSAVVLDMSGPAALGLQEREPEGGLSAERLRELDLLGEEDPAGVADQDGDLADLTAPAERHVDRGGDVPALDQLAAQLAGRLRVGNVQRLAGGQHAPHARRLLVEHEDVVRIFAFAVGAGADRPAAELEALGELGHVDLIHVQGALELPHEHGLQLVRGAAGASRLGEAGHGGQGGAAPRGVSRRGGGGPDGHRDPLSHRPAPRAA